MAAFVLGNGVSREPVSVNQLLELGSVYGCNGLYRTHAITALVATDQPIAKLIQDSGYSKKHRFYTRRPLPNTGAVQIAKTYFGYSSGPIATSIAAADGHGKIYLLGFDMGPDNHGKFNNVYAGTEYYKAVGTAPTFTGNWVKQLAKIMTDYPARQFVRVYGDTTAKIAEFDNASNLQHITLATFLERINTRKDL
jgi:hypothetical protein